jgi:NAD(P)-dependent dehydrogenase (short-subunit alcohol dehydrogenase family)
VADSCEVAVARVVISGSATGIGAALRSRLEASGDEVVGIDLRGAEIEADLSSADGRGAAVEAVRDRCDGCLDRLVLCAGLGGHVDDHARVASVNYFGVTELLDRLLPSLRQGEAPAAVAIASNSAQLAPEIADWPLVEALLSGDEQHARAVANETSGQVVYIASKNAVGRAVRRRAKEWGEAGVRLNAVAPGTTQTPLLEAGLAEQGSGHAIRSFPVPLGRWAAPDEIAAVIAFLLGPEAGFVHGAVWYVDGGSDAMTRPDRF